MSQLREKKINYMRTWIDPENPTVIPNLDYDIIYPITVYEAIYRTMDEGSTTLDAELESIYRLIADKQDAIQGGVPGKLMTWTTIKGQIGETEIVRSIGDDQSSRSHTKVPSEKAVGQALDLKANASSFNEHNWDKERHIYESERERWNDMTPMESFRDHSENEEIHVTESERKAWNNKADQEKFNSHLANANNPHNVTAHQVNAYTREEVDMMFESIRESFFNYRNIEYDDRTDIAKLVEYESTNWNPNYILAYADSLPEVTDQSLTYFALKPVTDYATNESQECIIYIKKPGLVWKEVGLQTMNPGDMVIRYPDTTMCVWVQGRFISLFTGSTAAGENTGSVTSSGWVWRPVITEDGLLAWTKSSEVNPPDPITIKGAPGYTPIKGVDYYDGAPGIGVPAGGRLGDIIVKTTGEDYDTKWISFSDFLNDYFESDEVPNGFFKWDNIVGKPKIHNSTGEDENGLMSQKSITDEFTSLNKKITDLINQLGSSGTGGISEALKNHMTDYNNPHRVTPESIGAVSNSTFITHTLDQKNPHNITAKEIGLDNVNNTSDIDKPVSKATQQALNSILEKINIINGIIDSGSLITNVIWNNTSCKLTFTFRDGSEMDVVIPIIEIFNTIYYDENNKELVIILPDGSEKRINIKSLITSYIGEESLNIKVEVKNGKINATLLPDSITGDELVASINLRESPTTTTQLPEDSSNKIATTRFVKNVVKNDLISYDIDRPLSANMGRILNQNKVDIETVLQIIADTPLMNVVDTLSSTDSEAALSANMGHELFLTKAPLVHTSPSGSTFGRATVSLFGHARASDLDPLMDGLAFVGTDDGYYARADHRHPTDVSRAPMHWPDKTNGLYKFTGEPRATTPPVDSNDDRIATTEWVRMHVGQSDVFTALTSEIIFNAVENAYNSVLSASEAPISFNIEDKNLVAEYDETEHSEPDLSIDDNGDLILNSSDTVIDQYLERTSFDVVNDNLIMTEEG